jgi:hypothetical protein
MIMLCKRLTILYYDKATLNTLFNKINKKKQKERGNLYSYPLNKHANYIETECFF